VRFLITTSLLILLAAEKPKVHSDFHFGTYPTSREAETFMKDEKARLVTVAHHVGWSAEKLTKELKDLKLTTTELIKVSDDMEDSGMLRRGDYDAKPAMVIIRERDFDRLKDSLARTTQEFTKVVRDNWKAIDAFVDTLEGSKHLPRERVLYEVVVSGILLGGLVDAFWEDGTLMLNPPRRGKAGRYYAWLVESNPSAMLRLKREIRESSGYRIVTIGQTLAEEKLNVDDLRGNGSVYDEADARRYRTFISVFSRDKLFPYFKSRRSEFVKSAALIEAARNIALAEFIAWYYFTVAGNVADELAAAKLISPPDTLYTYAIMAPR